MATGDEQEDSGHDTISNRDSYRCGFEAAWKKGGKRFQVLSTVTVCSESYSPAQQGEETSKISQNVVRNARGAE